MRRVSMRVTKSSIVRCPATDTNGVFELRQGRQLAIAVLNVAGMSCLRLRIGPA